MEQQKKSSGLKLKDILWIMSGICFAISIALGLFIMRDMNKLLDGKVSTFQLRNSIWNMMDRHFNEFEDGVIPLESIQDDLDETGKKALTLFDVTVEKLGDEVHLVVRDKKTRNPRGKFTKSYAVPVPSAQP